ncbi:DUF5333 domain-containing protein [Pseudaestuariivita rosea]|uniref:DUF5333 domain-containing protein n=1 Tax=Pseudaestuariivita rosea TaxID=2763263 RepID=UPI001ABA1A0E|nr:DUF5333 domain-containing protein [Pseudaestuariivita rosea]
MKKIFIGLIAGLMSFAIVTTADAKGSLRDNTRVNNELLAAAVGDEIRKNCSSIAARFWYVLNRARQLEQYAMAQGFTKQEIEDYVESDVERDRMKALRDRYLAQNGVTKGDEASYCRLGEKEIADNTLIGSLLRKR